jgi:hypothetical protein
MSDQRYNAMRQAVALALSGRYSNWWAVTARLRARRYREADVDWSEGQRMWLDQLCNEARLAIESEEAAPARRPCPVLAVIEGGCRRGGPTEGRPRPLRTQRGQLNHRLR